MTKILGCGSPIIDLMLQVPDSFLDEIFAKKGEMTLVDHDTFSSIVNKSKVTPEILPGGSTTNVIRALANLGNPCALFGTVGSDEFGAKYLEMCNKLSIVPYLKLGSLPTARTLCLVTPDTERTFRVYPGASSETSLSDIKESLFEGVSLVHLEGYYILYIDLLEKIVQLAKQAGARISLDLGNFQVVNDYKEEFLSIIANIDILFGNALEARELFGLEPEETCKYVSERYGCAVVISMGKDGCWASHGQGECFLPAFKVKAIDSTGAGDLFSAGYLHQYLRGMDVRDCCWLGARIGSEVVQVMGPDLDEKTWKKIRKELEDQV